MPCLFALFAAFLPRLATLFLWLARPLMVNAAFGGSWLWPILGIIFLPFATLFYIILYTPGIGLTSGDWIWIIMAVIIDVMHWVQTGYNNRNQIPGYSSTPNTPSGPSVPGPSGSTPTSSDPSGS